MYNNNMRCNIYDAFIFTPAPSDAPASTWASALVEGGLELRQRVHEPLEEVRALGRVPEGNDDARLGGLDGRCCLRLLHLLLIPHRCLSTRGVVRNADQARPPPPPHRLVDASSSL